MLMFVKSVRDGNWNVRDNANVCEKCLGWELECLMLMFVKSVRDGNWNVIC